MVSFQQSDLDELRSYRRFLSDVIMEFYFSYLSSRYPSDSILFVPPTICYMVSNSRDADDIKGCVEPLQLPSKKLVIFPVNDGQNHWSLLVYYRALNFFVHHDSLKGRNDWDAKKLYRTLKKYVNEIIIRPEISRKRKRKRWRRRFMADEPEFRLACTPQQTNMYDCGLYVMAIAKVICEWYCSDSLDKGTHWELAVNLNVDVSLQYTMRPHLLQLIEKASLGMLGSVTCTVEAEDPDFETLGWVSFYLEESDRNCGRFIGPLPRVSSNSKGEEEAANDGGKRDVWRYPLEHYLWLHWLLYLESFD